MKITLLAHFSLGGGNYAAPGTVYTDENGESIPAWVMDEVVNHRGLVEVEGVPAVAEETQEEQDEAAPVKKVTRVKKS